jgi:hypothetical protein
MSNLGLGDFWRCIHREVSVAAPTFLERLDEYEIVCSIESVPDDCEFDSVIPAILQTDLVDSYLWLCRDSDGALVVQSCYPTVIEGCGKVEASVVSHEGWPKNVEGYLTVNVGGKEFTVFDALYPAARERYTVGETINLSLSGLALSVHRMSNIIEHVNDCAETSSMVARVYETGESWFGHSKKAVETPELHVLFCRLMDVAQGTFGDIKLYRVTVALFPGVVVPVVFGETSIDDKGMQIEPGAWVCMMVFLHGYRTGLRHKSTSPGSTVESSGDQ